ncbi:uncharacterized protein LOC101163803 isoform X2 [Oryzias latipes]|uniref:uncharacterized protein LOC101163803 isoform X2 n=1 Tax=Oryzias latipes TaxID=8090 RepID=UPI0002A4C10A|nr:uncharacterized protein LOC101163803 isoform X2 [Oryzias latipes]
MSSVEFLREFISERLDAAAERILARYERTVEEYEEKSERRRRQTDISWSPDQVQPPALVLPQDSMNADGEERSSEVKQEVAEASQVKDEEEELSIAPDEEPLDVKQEADAAMKTPEGE